MLGMAGKNITTGAVCVYPNRVKEAVAALKGTGIPVASVAAGFPAGQTPLHLRLEEIKCAVADGAAEIDIVISREHVLGGHWGALYDEIKAMRAACGEAHLKSILATGDLGTLTNVYKASLVAMMAGSDVIKTSTGKEGVNATFPVAFTMVRALRDYYEHTGFKVRAWEGWAWFCFVLPHWFFSPWGDQKHRRSASSLRAASSRPKTPSRGSPS